jgi:glycosyltransferase involved in cell wall biosynthesis
MRIAFYAPLKPPDHPVPSGDRRVARLLIEALRRAGHQVELASRFRSRDRGDAARQARLEAIGGRLAERYARRAGPRPDLWFTYHLYDKAADWIGPHVARALGIPYVVAEASVAPSRAGGAWARGHAAVTRALNDAGLVLHLNSADEAGVASVRGNKPALRLKPFLDAAPFDGVRARRAGIRENLAERLGLDASAPWLVTVAMMRAGDKLASYRVLGEAMSGLRGRSWQLLVAGDGPARAEVEAALAPLGDRVKHLGALAEPATIETLLAADLFLWPAINEAFGMALLEAQTAGLPVVAGRTGGVPDIVAEGESGLLAEVGSAADFAAAVTALLDDPDRRGRMGAAARRRVAAEHTIESASSRLDAALAGLAAPTRVV